MSARTPFDLDIAFEETLEKKIVSQELIERFMTINPHHLPNAEKYEIIQISSSQWEIWIPTRIKKGEGYRICYKIVKGDNNLVGVEETDEDILKGIITKSRYRILTENLIKEYQKITRKKEGKAELINKILSINRKGGIKIERGYCKLPPPKVKVGKMYRETILGILEEYNKLRTDQLKRKVKGQFETMPSPKIMFDKSYYYQILRTLIVEKSIKKIEEEIIDNGKEIYYEISIINKKLIQILTKSNILRFKNFYDKAKKELDISKKTFIKHISQLVENGIIKPIVETSKEVYYKLTRLNEIRYENIDEDYFKKRFNLFKNNRHPEQYRRKSLKDIFNLQIINLYECEDFVDLLFELSNDKNLDEEFRKFILIKYISLWEYPIINTNNAWIEKNGGIENIWSFIINIINELYHDIRNNEGKKFTKIDLHLEGEVCSLIETTFLSYSTQEYKRRISDIIGFFNSYLEFSINDFHTGCMCPPIHNLWEQLLVSIVAQKEGYSYPNSNKLIGFIKKKINSLSDDREEDVRKGEHYLHVLDPEFYKAQLKGERIYI